MRKKRILSLILALLMLLIASACGGVNKPAGDSTAKGGTPAAESSISQESRSQKESGKTDQKDQGSAAADSKKAEQPEASEESKAAAAESSTSVKEETEGSLDPDGSYTSKEDVALYLHLYGKLPSNFITKKADLWNRMHPESASAVTDSETMRGSCRRSRGGRIMNVTSIPSERRRGGRNGSSIRQTDRSTTREIIMRPLNFCMGRSRILRAVRSFRENT